MDRYKHDREGRIKNKEKKRKEEKKGGEKGGS